MRQMTQAARSGWLAAAIAALAIAVIAAACGSDDEPEPAAVATQATPTPTPTLAPLVESEGSLEDLFIADATSGRELMARISQQERDSLRAAIGEQL